MAKQRAEAPLAANKRYVPAERADILERGLRALTGVVAMDFSGAQLDALRRKTDAELLVELAAKAVAREPLPISRREQARLAGEQSFHLLLEKAGGVLKLAEVCDRLGLTDDAIRKRVSRNKLLAVRRHGNPAFPVWQFDDQSEGGVVRNLPEVLALLDSDSMVARCRFFLTPDQELDGLTRIEALRCGGYLDLIRRQARRFGHQGAS